MFENFQFFNLLMKSYWVVQSENKVHSNTYKVLIRKCRKDKVIRYSTKNSFLQLNYGGYHINLYSHKLENKLADRKRAL